MGCHSRGRAYLLGGGRIFPSDSLRALAVIAVGALIMITTHEVRKGHLVEKYSRPFFQNVRRWFFGGAVILVGVISLIMDLSSLPRSLETLSVISLEAWAGQLILVAIGAIYLLSSSKKVRDIQIHRPKVD